RRDRSIHQARQTRLNKPKYKKAPGGFSFLGDLSRCSLLSADLFSRVFMPLLFLREIIQQLANADVSGLLCRRFVKTTRFNFHDPRLLTRLLRPKIARDPRRPPNHKTLNIPPLNERNMFAELLPVQISQPMAMPILFRGHFDEQVGGGREIRAQTISKVAIDM